MHQGAAPVVSPPCNIPSVPETLIKWWLCFVIKLSYPVLLGLECEVTRSPDQGATAIELVSYTPQYARRDAVKSQALADFLVDWAEMQYEPPLPDSNYWRMHFDGSRTKIGLGAGVEIGRAHV